MKGRAARAKRAPAPAPVAPPRITPVPLRHPAMIFLLLAGAAMLVISSSYQLYETDLWQHLAMGRTIWERGIPRVNLWTWPQFGEPYFLASWGFRALLWPLWEWGGIWALFAWRWGTTIAIFAVLLATARAMGARGFSAVLVLMWVSLDYRMRTDVRPETLGSLLLVAAIWLLERDRLGAARGRQSWWLVALAAVWANAHISYYLGFVALGFYALDALLVARRRDPSGDAGRARFARLLRIGLASAVVSLVNPFGWVALWQPFQFALFWRNDPLVRTIGELQPLPWRDALANGMWIWPLLLSWRLLRRRLDVVEILACAYFTAVAMSSLRFVGTYALVAGPFMARDLHELVASRRWPVPRLPYAARAALTVAAGVLLCVWDWIRIDLPLGIAMDRRTFPAGACDFIEAHGIRGRIVNNMSYGGYLAYRFGPDRGRLPFVSSQPEYTPKVDRDLYLSALRTEAGWRTFQAKHDIDLVVFEREQAMGDSLLDFLDRDPRFVMVFSDDAAELLIRRDRFPAVADSFGYRLIPAGKAARFALGLAAQQDSGFRAAAVRELDRMIASSPMNGGASHIRGFFALMDGDFEGARRALERTVRLKPLVPVVHDLLGTIALTQGRWGDAIREYDTERRYHEAPAGLYYRTGMAWRHRGDLAKARAFYRRELERDASHSAARDSLAALEASAP